MKNTKFVVRVNRAGPHTTEYVHKVAIRVLIIYWEGRMEIFRLDFLPITLILIGREMR